MTFNSNQLRVINDLVNQGRTATYIAEQIGCEARVVREFIHKNKLRTTEIIPPNYKDIDIEKLKEAYIRGDSVLKMSKDFGVGRDVITRRLKKLGYKIRSGSEANLIRFKNSTAAYRQEITKKAHEKVRGQKRSDSTRINAAKSREATANQCLKLYSHLGRGEIELFTELSNKGLNPISQKAFNFYNIDLFIEPNIFIELSCDTDPLKSQCVRKRQKVAFVDKVKKLADNNAVIVEINFIDIKCLVGNFDNIIAFFNSIRCNPPTSSKHFMLSCYYEFGALGLNFDEQRFFNSIRPKYPKCKIAEIDTLSFC